MHCVESNHSFINSLRNFPRIEDHGQIDITIPAQTRLEPFAFWLGQQNATIATFWACTMYIKLRFIVLPFIKRSYGIRYGVELKAQISGRSVFFAKRDTIDQPHPGGMTPPRILLPLVIVLAVKSPGLLDDVTLLAP